MEFNIIISILLASVTITYGSKLMKVDLTHMFVENATAYWQMKDTYRVTKRVRTTYPTYKYESNSFCAKEHGGTHIDAPRHMAHGKEGVHEIPLDRLIAKPFIIDVSGESSKNPDYELDVPKIQEAEKQQGKIPDGSMLLINTGFSLKWGNLTDYFGGDPTNSSQYHFPGISPAAAQWLVDNRKIASVGLDTPSIDCGQSKNFQAHVILYNQNIPGFENVDLSKIKTWNGKKDLLIIALPMKIKDGTGAPTRMVATFTEDEDDKSSAIMTVTSLLMVTLATCMGVVLTW